ncbi:TetR family transcriptional regulator [Novosphingobium sp. CF614]|uniref:TetR family transcriptional regulator n=1 Tax=Novosphingobium sp. CF614 TaxID=1884364 RepID=UPI001C430446|nr:TetR family transcriptional regulator [Novosphingobium sp. CF614]
MIEEAALDLFASQGYEATTVEQIAAQVEISTTTFFRYFPSKADVVLCQQDGHLPELRRVILSRPASESGLAAVRHAMLQVWVPNVDPEHTLRAGLAVANSATLRGLYNDLNRTWLDGIAEALAERKGLSSPDEEVMITARVALGVFNEAIRAWGNGECGETVDTMVERGFAALTRLCAEWGAEWARTV